MLNNSYTNCLKQLVINKEEISCVCLQATETLHDGHISKITSLSVKVLRYIYLFHCLVAKLTTFSTECQKSGS